MPNELFTISNDSGLSVQADLYRAGIFISTVALNSQASGASGTTIYRGNMPGGLVAGRYFIAYRTAGNQLGGMTDLWWNGTAEVNLATIESNISIALGSGFATSTDSLRAISTSITQITTGGSGGSGSFTTEDRSALVRIESFAKDGSAGAVGLFTVDSLTNIGTLFFKDGSVAKTFRLRDVNGQLSIVNAVQRTNV